jgi:ABC-type phosphate/phosphonate transport system permease subunit
VQNWSEPAPERRRLAWLRVLLFVALMKMTIFFYSVLSRRRTRLDEGEVAARVIFVNLFFETQSQTANTRFLRRAGFRNLFFRRADVIRVKPYE